VLLPRARARVARSWAGWRGGERLAGPGCAAGSKPARTVAYAGVNRMDEHAKAAQEIAKATREGISAVRDLGRFVSGPLEEVLGMLQDRLKYTRWERQVRLVRRAEQFLQDAGVPEPTKTLPLKVAVPLLEAASLEEDDGLQDAWAAMLANAANADSEVEIRRALISILQDFGVLEARLLTKIVNAPEEVKIAGSVVTVGLPDKYTTRLEAPEPAELPPEDIQIALWNLVRLGCVATPMTWGGPNVYAVDATALGRELVRACTVPARGQHEAKG
jgi:hypothetical protein